MKRNITLAIDDNLVREVRKIALDRDTTLTGLVREYLEKLAAENAQSDEKRRAMEKLEESFKRFEVHVGKRTWTRADLHERD
jgi:predicted transcriptional regulator